MDSRSASSTEDPPPPGARPAGSRSRVTVTVRGQVGDFDSQDLAAFAHQASSSTVSSDQVGDDLVDLVFDHESADLWTVLLAAMNASWTGGHEPVAVTARSGGLGPGRR